MTTENLTGNEKASLLANLDIRGLTARDEDLERIIAETLPLPPHQLTDPIRNALRPFTQELLSMLKKDIANAPESFDAWVCTRLAIAWLNGYQVALKWGKSIEKYPESK